MTEGDVREDGGRPGAGAPTVTPYELAFGEVGFEERIFVRVLAEAEANAEDPLRWERFGFLSVAADAVRDLVPPEAPPEMSEEVRALFYHAFNFWRLGKRVYALEPALARYLVEGAPRLAGWELTLPHPSIYVQLPPRLFWASISTEVPPEPVDGFFVTTSPGADPLGAGYDDLHVLMVLGIRRERAGFSIIHFDTEVGPGIPAVWAETPGREGAADYANILPGGEIAGLYSILTHAEAVKLLARTLWYIDTHPLDVGLEVAPERRAEDRPGSLPLSRIPYHRVRLGDPDSLRPQGAGG